MRNYSANSHLITATRINEVRSLPPPEDMTSKGELRGMPDRKAEVSNRYTVVSPKKSLLHANLTRKKSQPVPIHPHE
jgi:hypothetical protein